MQQKETQKRKLKDINSSIISISSASGMIAKKQAYYYERNRRALLR